MKLIEPLPGQPFKTLTVRLPIDLYTQLARLATEERRTLTSQLLVLLEEALQSSAEAQEERKRIVTRNGR